jgi:hypothetical protein
VGSRTIEQLAADFERTEITILWLDDGATRKHTLLFGVAELCPIEQDASTPFVSTNGKFPVLRTELHEGTVLCVTRAFLPGHERALDFFRCSAGSRSLSIHGTDINFQEFNRVAFDPSPTHFQLAQCHNNDVYSVLPKREGLRVASSFADGFSVRDAVCSTAKERERIARFTKEVLGFNLVEYCEHFGAIHLVGSNPYLRNHHLMLARSEDAILLELYPRVGKSVVGMKFEIREKRAHGLGFTIRTTIDSTRHIISIPYAPAGIETTLFDQYGDPIDHSPRSSFLRAINLSLGISTITRTIVEASANGSAQASTKVNVFSYERDSVKVGAQPADLDGILRKAERSRQKSSESRYFPPDTRSDAKEFIRTLIGAARHEVIVCDPYFTTTDLIAFVPFTTVSRIPFRILSSKMAFESAGAAESLKAAVLQLGKDDSSLNIELRLLAGKPCFVHDRFLVVDKVVYSLGSSLNGLGLRASVVVKLAETLRLQEEIHAWWEAANQEVIK